MKKRDGDAGGDDSIHRLPARKASKKSLHTLHKGFSLAMHLVNVPRGYDDGLGCGIRINVL